MDDFGKYENLRDRGASAQEVYLAAKADKLDSITLIRLLRRVFVLSLVEAKQITVIADHQASSLEEFQETLIPIVEEALAQQQASSSNGSQKMGEKGTKVMTD